MKFIRTAAIAATAFVSLATTPSQAAAPIVYTSQVLKADAFSATYSITTDGTIGSALDQSNVLDFLITLTDDQGSYSFTKATGILDFQFAATSNTLSFANTGHYLSAQSTATVFGNAAASFYLSTGYLDLQLCATGGCRSAGGEGQWPAAFATTEGAVPEPATWAMMLAGFGCVGFALRRRQKISTRVRFA